MADNTTLNAGAGGDTIAADDIVGVKFPRSKITLGADGVNDGDVSAANPLPISGAVTVSSGTVTTVSAVTTLGNITGTVSLPTGASTAAKQPALGTAGVASTDVISVQGIAAMTPITVSLATTTVTGTVAVTQSGTWDEVGINDSGNSITVDWAGTAPPIGAGLEATALRVTLATDSTGVVSVDDNGAALTVDNGGTFAVQAAVDELPAAAALTDNFANPTTTSIASMGMLWDGATWDRALGNATDGALVNLGTNNDVTVTSGTITLSAGTNTNEVVGDVADDAAAAGNPVSIGLTARTTNRTAVTDGDNVRAAADDMGRQVVVQGQVRDLIGQQHTQIASSSAETTIVTAVASTFCDLVQLVLTNQTATAVNCTIKDSTAGTTRMIVALAASGGAVIPFARPIPQATVNTNWTCTLSSAAVTVNIFALFEKNV